MYYMVVKSKILCFPEKNDLLLRNAELSQTFEAFKRDTADAQSDLVQQVKDKDNAIAGLEQSLEDITQEMVTAQERVKCFTYMIGLLTIAKLSPQKAL